MAERAAPYLPPHEIVKKMKTNGRFEEKSNIEEPYVDNLNVDLSGLMVAGSRLNVGSNYRFL